MNTSLPPSKTNENFPPTEDNPLGGLHVVYDDTLSDADLPTLYEKAAKLKFSILKAKTIAELRQAFDTYHVPELTVILNYINSPTIDYLYTWRGEKDFQLMFHAAIQSGRLDVVKYLVKIGVDPRGLMDYPVVLASRHGHLPIVKYLVSLGADVTAKDNAAICDASYSCHLDVIKYLVELGVSVSVNDNLPIRFASYTNHLPTIKYLVEQGADVTARNNQAVCIAHKEEHQVIVDYLLSVGAK